MQTKQIFRQKREQVNGKHTKHASQEARAYKHTSKQTCQARKNASTQTRQARKHAKHMSMQARQARDLADSMKGDI